MKKLFLIICIVSSFLYSCEKDEKDPSVTMVSAVAISASSGEAVARVDQAGDYKIIDHGFVFSFANSMHLPEIVGNNPTNKISLGSIIKADTFFTTIPLTAYDNYFDSNYWWVWAYITNEKGTVYSSKPINFAPKKIQFKSVSPIVGIVGDTLTLSGTNFDTSISNVQVKFYNNYESDYVLATIISASETAIKIIVPNLSGISSYNYGSQFSIKLKMGNIEKGLSDAFVLRPFPAGFSPKKGTFGTSITISGTLMDNISVMLGDTYADINERSSTSITFSVPLTNKQKKSKIYIVKGRAKIEVPGGEFEMLPLTLSSVLPLKVWPGDLIEVTGSNFNSDMGSNFMMIGSVQFWSNYETKSSSNFYIPGNMAAGEYTVGISNGVDTLVMPKPLKVVIPSITNVSPASVYPGDLLTITGHNFTNMVYIDGFGHDFASAKHDSVSFEIKVPSLSPGTHTVEIRANNHFYNDILSSKEFTVMEPISHP